MDELCELVVDELRLSWLCGRVVWTSELVVDELSETELVVDE